MKAVVFHEFGASDVLRLEDLPDPSAGPGEVVVEVTASALNHLDVDVREGTSRFPIAFPHTLGVEPVGRIAELGDGVEGWSVGDRVAVYLIATCGTCVYCRTSRESLCTAPDWFIGMGTGGGYAERVTCKATQLIPIPEGVTDVEAAASNIAFGTAWHMLITRAKLRAGETVLVNSVGSGIGSAAVQIAKLAGAVVLLPLSSLGTVSDRADVLGYHWSTRLAYWPSNVLTFLVPYINGDISNNTYIGPPFFWEDYGYIGVLAFLMAIYGGVRERLLDRPAGRYQPGAGRRLQPVDVQAGHFRGGRQRKGGGTEGPEGRGIHRARPAGRGGAGDGRVAQPDAGPYSCHSGHAAGALAARQARTLGAAPQAHGI